MKSVISVPGQLVGESSWWPQISDSGVPVAARHSLQTRARLASCAAVARCSPPIGTCTASASAFCGQAPQPSDTGPGLGAAQKTTQILLTGDPAKHGHLRITDDKGNVTGWAGADADG